MSLPPSFKSPAPDDAFLLRLGRTIYESARWTAEREALLAQVNSITVQGIPANDTTDTLAEAAEPVSGPVEAIGIQASELSRQAERIRSYLGLFGRVARANGVARSTVSGVVHGQATSRKIAPLIVAEVRRIESLYGGRHNRSKPGWERLYPQEMPAEFSRALAYQGFLAKVARTAGVNHNTIAECVIAPERYPNLAVAMLNEIRDVEQALAEGRYCIPARRTFPRPPEAMRIPSYTGALSRVAKACGTRIAFVSEVALGKRGSKRIMDAIVAEVRRLEALPVAERGLRLGHKPVEGVAR